MNEFWHWFEEYAVPKLKNNSKTNRTDTFRKIFEHLDQFKNPLIIETGCADPSKHDWLGAGNSTLLFDKYVSLNGGTLHSCDLDEIRINNIRVLVSDNCHIHHCDSVKFLEALAEGLTDKPVLVYLDSHDLVWYLEIESQIHHYNELRAIMPKLTPDTLVVVDDSPAIIDEKSDYEVRGKGGLVAKCAKELGVPIIWSEYQTAWQGFPGFRQNNDESNEEIIYKAREFVEEGKWANAYPLYKTLLGRTSDYDKHPKQRIIHGEACVFFARLESNAERIGTAYDWYMRALKADPRAIEYRLELIAKILVPMGNLTRAKSEAKRATRIEPEDHRAWRMLANVHGVMDEAEDAIKMHRKQIEISNRDPIALF